MKRASGALWLLVAVAVLCGCASVSQRNQLLADSRTKAASGDFTGARGDLDELIRRWPTFVDPYRERAALNQRESRLSDALADLDHVVDLDPRDAAATRLQSTLSGQMLEDANAIAAWEKAIALNPNDAIAHRRLAEVEIRRSNFARALAEVEKAIAITPQRGYVYAVRARIKRRTGDFDGALADYERAVQLAPNDPYSLFFIGMLKAQKRLLSDALIAYNRGLAIVGDRRAYSQRGMIRYALGDVRGGEEDFELANGDDPPPPDLASLRPQQKGIAGLKPRTTSEADFAAWEAIMSGLRGDALRR